MHQPKLSPCGPFFLSFCPSLSLFFFSLVRLSISLFFEFFSILFFSTFFISCFLDFLFQLFFLSDFCLQICLHFLPPLPSFPASAVSARVYILMRPVASRV